MAINSKRKLNIDKYIISDDTDAFVIAEIGHNHQGNVDLCEQMFIAAAKAGANSVKLQKRDNRSLYTEEYYNSPYNSHTSFGSTYGEHREFLEFNKKEYTYLQQVAKDLKLVFFATAFDIASADFLLDLEVPVVKIASGDLRSSPLITYLSKADVPLIISTGGATINEITRALEDVNPKNIGLLQCTAAYPADPEEMDLRVIEKFRKLFPETVIGLSSHDRGISFPIAAYALGARIIEKHFTIDRSLKGTDHAFSLEPSGMEKMIRDLKLIRLALGDGEKKVHEKEKSSVRKMAKMLVYADSLKIGHRIREQDLTLKSPGDGLNPQIFRSLIGKVLKNEVQESQKVVLEDFNSEVV
jgi:N-acetylneuraminate synthase/sialic acid synthase